MADIVHELKIGAAPERIWDAITTGNGLEVWWTADATAEPAVGSVAVFGFGHRSATRLRMAVETLERGRVVRWRCVGDDPEWKTRGSRSS